MNLLVMNWRDPRSPLAGGAEVRFVELFSRILRRGHSVTLLSSGYPGSLSYDKWNGFDMFHAGNEYTFPWSAKRFYLSHFGQKSFDCVVEMMNKLPLGAPRFVRHPLRVMVDHLFGNAAFSELPWPMACYVRYRESQIGKSYRSVPFIAVSESTQRDLVDHGIPEKHIQLVYNGVDTQFYFPDPHVGKTEYPSVLYLGRLKKYKRIDFLLTSLEDVVRKEPSAKLVIVGKGDDLPRLKALVRRYSLGHHAEFKGYVSEEEKRTLLRRSWILAMPSLREGWGMVSLEAQACGTPVIVADSPGIRETVQEGVSGLLVKGDLREGFSEKILLLLKDKSLCERLGKGGVEFSRRYQWDDCAKELMRVLTGHELAETVTGFEGEN